MHVTLPSEKFKTLLHDASIGHSNKATLPILHHALITVGEGILQMRTTDLDVSSCAHVAASPQEAGETTVDVRFLHSLMGEWRFPEVELKTDAATLQLRHQNRVIYSLLTFPPEEFPAERIAADDADDAEAAVPRRFAIPAPALTQALRLAIVCVAKEEWHPVLSAALLELGPESFMVATDPHRMGYCRLPVVVEEPYQILLPYAARLYKLFRKQEGMVQIEATASFARFSWSEDGRGWAWTTRVVDGQFPAWRKVIPDILQAPYTVVLQPDDCVSLLKSAYALSGDIGKLVMTLSPQNLHVHTDSSEAGAGDVDIPAQVEGYEKGELTLGLSAKYFLDYLSYLRGPVKIWIPSADMHPLVMGPADADPQDHAYVVMPMQVVV